MSDLNDIMRGLAANATEVAVPGVEMQVSPYLLDDPPLPSIQIAGVVDYDYLTFGGGDIEPGMSWLILVEVALGKVSEESCQDLFRRLVAPTGPTSLVAAIESDALLTRRMADGGTVSDAEAAAQSVSFEEFRGQTPFTLPNNVRVLLASWVFQVIT